MAGSCRAVRPLAMRGGLAFAAILSLALPAEAQWLLPFGAAPPTEIVQRLRAEGYVVVGPLQRRDTVYLADISRGPRGRERLVLDAWSGEILQRFLVRRGRYVPEGSELGGPPPLGPPPPRAFGEGDFGYGVSPGGYEPPQRTRGRPKPSVARRTAEPKPRAAGQDNIGPGNPAATPPAAATPTPLASPGPAADSTQGAQPKPASPTAPAEATRTAPAPASGKGEKKVNDVPVNPLD